MVSTNRVRRSEKLRGDQKVLAFAIMQVVLWKSVRFCLIYWYTVRDTAFTEEECLR